MTLSVADHGSLAVAWNVQDEKQINAELHKLSRSLFLDPALDPRWGVYWTVRDGAVKNDRGEPIVVVSWREPHGPGKPLSFGIVEQVKQQEGRIAEKARDAIEHNRRHVEKLRENAEETYGDIVRDHRKRMKAAESRTLPPFWRPRFFGKK